MASILLTIVAFVIALGVLIAVHEFGHYRVAVACGVQVLRFSVGFGKTVWRWQPKGSATEFVIGMFPLGGYVRMLDEREAPVAPELRHLAFNNQPLAARAAIVAAGPLINLLLAVLLYALVNWGGVQQPRAILASPVPASIADKAGIVGGELVRAAGMDGEPIGPVRSFDDLRWRLAQGALQGQDVRLALGSPDNLVTREVVLGVAQLGLRDVDATLFRRIGITGPLTQPVMGELIAGGAAAKAGLREGDRVLRMGDTRIVDGQQLREAIRASVRGGQALASAWTITRAGLVMELQVEPVVVEESGRAVGRIGAYVGGLPEMVTVRYGILEGAWSALTRTWEVSVLTVRMLGSMVLGEASLKNLNGPITIADYAGKSASQGLSHYLAFLALISISLGVLNLLPLPVLDGGHLMYYLWEAVTGKGVTEAWMARLQRGGVAVLLMMMGIALYNDLARILG